MKIIRESISLDELKHMAIRWYGELVKAVVDIDRGIMAVDGEMHADEEQMLLEDGSKQEFLWGINIYPGKTGDDRIEFDSMINVRPSQKNLSRSVEDITVRKKIVDIVKAKIAS